MIVGVSFKGMGDESVLVEVVLIVGLLSFGIVLIVYVVDVPSVFGMLSIGADFVVMVIALCVVVVGVLIRDVESLVLLVRIIALIGLLVEMFVVIEFVVVLGVLVDRALVIFEVVAMIVVSVEGLSNFEDNIKVIFEKLFIVNLRVGYTYTSLSS